MSFEKLRQFKIQEDLEAENKRLREEVDIFREALENMWKPHIADREKINKLLLKGDE
tara:strand:+ start:226 stop:396 length:171 start_codon:yes stop_codon:yes gene_type:complete